jgi:dienelactone hydrolase
MFRGFAFEKVAMQTSELTYEHEGLVMRGYLADGSRETPSPGVIVAHEAPGLDDHIRGRAELLALEGYVALALDLYGGHFSLDEARKRNSEMMTTPGLMLGRTRAALSALAAQKTVDRGRLAAVGFCQGGIAALELARSRAPILAAIGLHPGLMRPAGSSEGPISAKVLMMVGDEDPVVPQEDRLGFADEMTLKGADWQLHLFGGVGHSFSNPAIDALGMPRFRYDATAASRAWTMTKMLLEEVFRGAG